MNHQYGCRGRDRFLNAMKQAGIKTYEQAWRWYFDPDNFPPGTERRSKFPFTKREFAQLKRRVG